MTHTYISRTRTKCFVSRSYQTDNTGTLFTALHIVKASSHFTVMYLMYLWFYVVLEIREIANTNQWCSVEVAVILIKRGGRASPGQVNNMHSLIFRILIYRCLFLDNLSLPGVDTCGVSTINVCPCWLCCVRLSAWTQTAWVPLEMYVEIVKVDIGIKSELDIWTWNAIPSLIQNYLDNENLFWFSISDKKK